MAGRGRAGPTDKYPSENPSQTHSLRSSSHEIIRQQNNPQHLQSSPCFRVLVLTEERLDSVALLRLDGWAGAGGSHGQIPLRKPLPNPFSEKLPKQPPIQDC